MIKVSKLGMLTLGAFMASCDLTLLGPDWIYSERPMNPVPSEYREAYARVEECLDSYGLPNRKNFEDAQFFEADEIKNINNRERARGLTELPGNKMIIVRDFKDVPLTYMHEMVHHASQLKNIVHYNEAFRTICDGGPVSPEQQEEINERVRMIKEVMDGNFDYRDYMRNSVNDIY